MKRIAIGLMLVFAAIGALHAADENQGVTAPGAKLQVLGEGYAFTEGPAADKEGNVYFTDQPNDRIMIWKNNGVIATFLQPSGRSNGLFFDLDGALLACADENNQLWSIDKDGKETVLIENYQGKLLNGPNDLWVHPSGAIYFTDPLYKRSYWKNHDSMEQDGQHVYRLSPDRRTLVRVIGDLVQPNGIIGTPDGKTLYIADIGDKKTYRYDVQSDGSLFNRKLFCEMGSDGMTIDDQGNVYLTGKGVSVFNPDGKKIEQIDVPENWTANVCFGCKDHKMLFITASKSVYGIETRVKGAY
ncbi:MAG: SMP-30/gluconolactonase/LRE family protein [bacterium]|nr:SMP-30/gluconolactonase/LRE family protein [bacterium]